MRIAFYLLLLATVVILAFWRGNRDERIAAVICVLGTVLTNVTGAALPVRFMYFHDLAFTVDFAVLLAFVALALRSRRFWPLWVAGLQLSAISIHLLVLAEAPVVGKTLGAALAFWSYPILLLIGVGAWRTGMIERWRTEAVVARGGEIT